jgi:hypothetical protein
MMKQQPVGQAPEPKLKTLVVLSAFVRDEEGELRPAFEPREMPSADKARMDGRRMAAQGIYAGVISWSRSADLVNGEFGDPVVLFQQGDVPDME